MGLTPFKDDNAARRKTGRQSDWFSSGLTTHERHKPAALMRRLKVEEKVNRPCDNLRQKDK